MPDEFEDGAEEETPRGLRAKLAEAAEQNRQMAEKLTAFEVRTILTDKAEQFPLVKPEDLKGVSLDQIEAKAAEVQESRQKMQADLLRDVLSRRGLDGEDLDQALADLLGRQVEDDGADAARRIRQVGNAEGKPIPKVNTENLHGTDAMEAHFAATAKKRR